MAKQETKTESARLEVYRARHGHLQRAADIIREALREAILEGELGAGERLREEELAREFQVSRTPVREALQQLSAEGLVQVNPHQGAVVTHITTDDILELYVVREALEGVAARLAARRATVQNCQALLDLVGEMEAIARAGANPRAAAISNLHFHAELRRAAGNHHLERFLSQIEHSVRRFGDTTFAYPGRIDSTVSEHRAILEAIMEHDTERAEQLAIHHMRQARQLRLRMLLEDI